MVTGSERGLAGLHALVASQRAHSAPWSRKSTAQGLRDLEPHLSRAVTAGAYYSQDAQVQPMLLVAHLLRLARNRGARVLTGTEVTGFLRDARPRGRPAGRQWRRLAAGAVRRTRLAHGRGGGRAWPRCQRAGAAAARVRAGDRAGAGCIVRHKVYAAEYLGDVASSDEAVAVLAVVEGSPASTILDRCQRERVGFDRAVFRVRGRGSAWPAVPSACSRCSRGCRVHAQLSRIPARTARTTCPIIGPDPRAPGLWHATGHEGAGIGLYGRHRVAAGPGAVRRRAGPRSRAVRA